MYSNAIRSIDMAKMAYERLKHAPGANIFLPSNVNALRDAAPFCSLLALKSVLSNDSMATPATYINKNEFTHPTMSEIGAQIANIIEFLSEIYSSHTLNRVRRFPRIAILRESIAANASSADHLLKSAKDFTMRFSQISGQVENLQRRKQLAESCIKLVKSLMTLQSANAIIGELLASGDIPAACEVFYIASIALSMDTALDQIEFLQRSLYAARDKILIFLKSHINSTIFLAGSHSSYLPDRLPFLTLIREGALSEPLHGLPYFTMLRLLRGIVSKSCGTEELIAGFYCSMGPLYRNIKSASPFLHTAAEHESILNMTSLSRITPELYASVLGQCCYMVFERNIHDQAMGVFATFLRGIFKDNFSSSLDDIASLSRREFAYTRYEVRRRSVCGGEHPVLVSVDDGVENHANAVRYVVEGYSPQVMSTSSAASRDFLLHASLTSGFTGLQEVMPDHTASDKHTTSNVPLHLENLYRMDGSSVAFVRNEAMLAKRAAGSAGEQSTCDDPDQEDAHLDARSFLASCSSLDSLFNETPVVDGPPTSRLSMTSDRSFSMKLPQTDVEASSLAPAGSVSSILTSWAEVRRMASTRHTAAKAFLTTEEYNKLLVFNLNMRPPKYCFVALPSLQMEVFGECLRFYLNCILSCLSNVVAFYATLLVCHSYDTWGMRDAAWTMQDVVVMGSFAGTDPQAQAKARADPHQPAGHAERLSDIEHLQNTFKAMDTQRTSRLSKLFTVAEGAIKPLFPSSARCGLESPGREDAAVECEELSTDLEWVLARVMTYFYTTLSLENPLAKDITDPSLAQACAFQVRGMYRDVSRLSTDMMLLYAREEDCNMVNNLRLRSLVHDLFATATEVVASQTQTASGPAGGAVGGRAFFSVSWVKDMPIPYHTNAAEAGAIFAPSFRNAFFLESYYMGFYEAMRPFSSQITSAAPDSIFRAFYETLGTQFSGEVGKLSTMDSLFILEDTRYMLAAVESADARLAPGTKGDALAGDSAAGRTLHKGSYGSAPAPDKDVILFSTKRSVLPTGERAQKQLRRAAHHQMFRLTDTSLQSLANLYVLALHSDLYAVSYLGETIKLVATTLTAQLKVRLASVYGGLYSYNCLFSDITEEYSGVIDDFLKSETSFCACSQNALRGKGGYDDETSIFDETTATNTHIYTPTLKQFRFDAAVALHTQLAGTDCEILASQHVFKAIDHSAKTTPRFTLSSAFSPTSILQTFPLIVADHPNMLKTAIAALSSLYLVQRTILSVFSRASPYLETPISESLEIIRYFINKVVSFLVLELRLQTALVLDTIFEEEFSAVGAQSGAVARHTQSDINRRTKEIVKFVMGVRALASACPEFFVLSIANYLEGGSAAFAALSPEEGVFSWAVYTNLMYATLFTIVEQRLNRFSERRVAEMRVSNDACARIILNLRAMAVAFEYVDSITTVIEQVRGLST